MSARRTAILAALLLAAAGCGNDPTAEVAAGNTSTPASTTVDQTSTTAVPPACTITTGSDAAVAALAGRLLYAPIHATVNRMTFDLELLDRLGIELHLVEIQSVEPIESAPLNILPGANEGDPPTNSFAGNSAFTSGAALEVNHRGETSTITLTLAAGGPDVIAAMGPVLQETDDELLADLCAIVAVYPGDEEPLIYGNPELVAIGLSEDSPAHAVTPAFTELVENSPTMADLATKR
jgi:hypothetical protein